jgi:hypothetical protein
LATITTGGIAAQALQFGDGSVVWVRGPGVSLQLDTTPAPPGFAAQAFAVDGAVGGWDAAIAANGLEPLHDPIGATPLAGPPAIAAAPLATLSMPGSDDSHVDFEVAPAPGDGLLLMVRNGDVVQWFIPLNADAALPDSAAPAAPDLQGIQPLAAPSRLRFRVPQSAMTSTAGLSPAGFSASSIAGAVLHFFRFPLVQDLIDGVVEKVVAWIAKEVESKAKTENFLRFDPEHNFPAMSADELSKLTGRTLLLTHGIFSSTTGAFAAFGKTGNPLLADLRTKYQNNIIGWDHFTVSKTPLENAKDLLTRLPDGMDVDVICHSRGALVTRAMFEDPSLQNLTAQKIKSVGSAIFVAGANQGSQLARFENLNRLLNIYSAVASIPLLGAAGVALGIIVGLLKVLAHGAVKLPSVVALNPDPAVNTFLAGLNGPLMTKIKQLVVVHANYDAQNGLLKEYLDWNVDQVFGTANDMVVPFTGAETFDQWLPVADTNNYRFGTSSVAQPTVMHTNFFYQQQVQDIIQQHT